MPVEPPYDEPNSRPEDKWAYWEDPDYIQSTQASTADTRIEIQALLVDNGYIGIPNSWGGGMGSEPNSRWYEGLTIFLRSDEYELSRAWYKQGELFAEAAEDLVEVTGELMGKGTNPETALAALLTEVRMLLRMGEKYLQLKHFEEELKLQEIKVGREQETLEYLQAQIRELRGEP